MYQSSVRPNYSRIVLRTVAQYDRSFPYNGRERSVLPAFSKNETLTLYCHILYVLPHTMPHTTLCTTHHIPYLTQHFTPWTSQPIPITPHTSPCTTYITPPGPYLTTFHTMDSAPHTITPHLACCTSHPITHTPHFTP